MKTKTVESLSAAIEIATGLALIAVPELVVRVLLGSELFATGIAAARLAGCGLLALGLACWPGGNEPTPQATRALFTYNLLAGIYLGYLRTGGGFVSLLLWPACALHLVLALLLASPAYRTIRP